MGGAKSIDTEVHNSNVQCLYCVQHTQQTLGKFLTGPSLGMALETSIELSKRYKKKTEKYQLYTRKISAIYQNRVLQIRRGLFHALSIRRVSSLSSILVNALPLVPAKEHPAPWPLTQHNGCITLTRKALKSRRELHHIYTPSYTPVSFFDELCVAKPHTQKR